MYSQSLYKQIRNHEIFLAKNKYRIMQYSHGNVGNKFLLKFELEVDGFENVINRAVWIIEREIRRHMSIIEKKNFRTKLVFELPRWRLVIERI